MGMGGGTERPLGGEPKEQDVQGRVGAAVEDSETGEVLAEGEIGKIKRRTVRLTDSVVTIEEEFDIIPQTVEADETSK